MKKILATVLGVVFAMFAFAGCNMAAADGTATGASGITSIVMMVVIIAVTAGAYSLCCKRIQAFEST